MKFIDLTGKKFGRLTAIRNNGRMWHCQCECGATTVVHGGNLRSGKQVSCGCLRAERGRRHGMYGSKLYRVWGSMIQRCHNPNDRAYKYYGARGIRVCDAWHDFAVFAADVGEPCGLTLDRIDNNGNYEPGNVRWASRRQQSRNTRATRMYTHNGVSMSLDEWAEHVGMPRERLRSRIRRGWSLPRALTSQLS